MAEVDIKQRLGPWLERWSIDAGEPLGPWLQNMSVARFAADEYLLHAGASGDTLYLIESGLVRLFYTTPDGRERNKAFYGAGQATGPVSAAIKGTAATFSIQCLTPCEAITFRLRDLLQLADDNPAIARLYRNLLADAFTRNEQREAILLTCNAEQRYRWFLEHEAQLLEQVAQFHIASYLGIDPVSLSRLKRQHKT